MNGKPLTDDDGAGAGALLPSSAGGSVVTMSFLGSNNILYPKEDREQKVLLYACRNCDHQVLPPLRLLFSSPAIRTVIRLSFFLRSFGSLSGIWSNIQMGRAAAVGRFRSILLCTGYKWRGYIYNFSSVLMVT